MDLSGRVATWLELAIAPGWRKNNIVIKIHPVDARQTECFALSMDGRWLCAGDRRLTLFNGLQSVERFLQLLRVEGFERGDSIVDAPTSDVPRYCLSLHGRKGLVDCAGELCAVESESDKPIRAESLDARCAAGMNAIGNLICGPT